jgi:light-regulated signal transduction histidine kinase (bacteriophytochrome)
MIKERAESSLDETSLRYLSTSVRSAERAGELIDDLLCYSRMGRSEMRRTVIDMSRLVLETLGNLKPGTEGRNISWKIRELSEVRGDPSMLRLVLQNLLSNAIKYTRSRERARVEVDANAKDADEAVFFVRDNGVGFDMHMQSSSLASSSGCTAQKSSRAQGIGLATVRRIVQRHGGRVWAEGCVGSGATIYFSLPTGREGPLKSLRQQGSSACFNRQ